MAQIIVRNLDESVRDQLRELARRHGRSMEEEVRDILRAAAAASAASPAQRGLGSRIRQRFADCHLDESFEIPEWRGHEPRPADFGE